MISIIPKLLAVCKERRNHILNVTILVKILRISEMYEELKRIAIISSSSMVVSMAQDKRKNMKILFSFATSHLAKL